MASIDDEWSQYLLNDDFEISNVSTLFSIYFCSCMWVLELFNFCWSLFISTVIIIRILYAALYLIPFLNEGYYQIHN